MKAVLVIDLPDGLMAEECDIDYQVYYSNENADSFLVAEGTAITLKPLPKAINYEVHSLMDYVSSANQYASGWNACLDEILGETDDAD